MPIVSPPTLVSKGSIYPNPANLSPAIAHAVGKGMSVNTMFKLNIVKRKSAVAL